MEFVARVATASGEIQERRFAAESKEALLQELESKGLYVFDVKTRSRIAFGVRGAKSVTNAQFLMFNHELATLVKAGLPILQSLEILLERMKHPVFRVALNDIYEQVRSGTALSDAFASHPTLFPSLYAPSLRAGERSGDLEGVIRRFIAYAKVIENIRKKVSQALIYPVILLVLALVVVGILLTFAIPKFSDLFVSYGRELPLITKLLVGLSATVRSNFILFTVGGVAAFVGLRAWIRTPSGAAKFDTIKIKIPWLGPVWHKFAISQLTRALATLLGGGIPLVTALEIAADAVSNKTVSAAVLDRVQLIREGQSLASALEDSKMVTPMVLEMVKVGEATGALTEMLINVADYYDEELESDISKVIAFLEPAMLIFMGIVIAVMLVAMYMPIFQLGSFS